MRFRRDCREFQFWGLARDLCKPEMYGKEA